MASIFTRIIAGELPSYRIFEDEHTFAFLARDALAHGHTLIVPKVEINDFTDVPEPYYSAVFRNARPIAQALKAAAGCVRVGTVIAGFEVPHFHLHLIPINRPQDLEMANAKVRANEEFLYWQKKICDELARPA